MRLSVGHPGLFAGVSLGLAFSSSHAQTVSVESYRFYTRGTGSAETSATCAPPGSVTTVCSPEANRAFEYLRLDPQFTGWWDGAVGECESSCDGCASGGAFGGASVLSQNPLYGFVPIDAPYWNWRGDFSLEANARAEADPNDSCSPGQAQAAGEGETEFAVAVSVSKRTGLTLVWSLQALTNGPGEHRAMASWEVFGPRGEMIFVVFEQTSGSADRSSIEEFVLEPGVYEMKYRAEVSAAAEAGQALEAKCRFGLELIFEEYNCPEIYSQPNGIKSCIAVPITLAPWVYVGTFPEYQWRKDGVLLVDGPTPHGSVIEGAREGGFSITHTGPADSGYYDCIVSNLCGLVITKPALVEISSCFGDLNCSGSVGVDDLAVVLANFGTHPNGGFELGDLNEDRTVNLSDISTLLNEFGRSCY